MYSYSPTALLESYHALKAKEQKEACSDVDTASTSTPTTASSDGFSVAAVQITASALQNNDVEGFWNLAQSAVADAAKAGSSLILLPELFIGPYFCQSQEADLMALAEPIDKDHFILKRMSQLAKQYGVVLPISLYERKNNALFNSLVMIDADGEMLGTYRT